MKSYFSRGVRILFKKYLLLTNSITSGLFMTIGDVVQQEFEYQTNVIHTRYDWDRAGIFF